MPLVEFRHKADMEKCKPLAEKPGGEDAVSSVSEVEAEHGDIGYIFAASADTLHILHEYGYDCIQEKEERML